MPSFRLHQKPLNDEAGGEESGPLGRLRQRCAIGAFGVGGVYLAVPVTTVLRPSTLTLAQTVALEVGLGMIALACTVVAVVLWALTENTSIALSAFKAGSAAAAANAALESRLLDASDSYPTPIPIQRGQEIRRHRGDRHAV